MVFGAVIHLGPLESKELCYVFVSFALFFLRSTIPPPPPIHLHTWKLNSNKPSKAWQRRAWMDVGCKQAYRPTVGKPSGLNSPPEGWRAWAFYWCGLEFTLWLILSVWPVWNDTMVNCIGHTHQTFDWYCMYYAPHSKQTVFFLLHIYY